MDVSITIQTQNPAGTILDFAGSVVPSGHLACDGSLILRATYPRLYATIGTTYGAGDGSTTFKLPDIRGRVTIGSGTGSSLTARTLGATGGAETHTLTESEMPSHTHTQNAHNHVQDPHSHTIQTRNVGSGAGATSIPAIAGDPTNALSDVQATAINNPATATNQNTGGGAAHNNMQPFLVVSKVIKF